MIEKTWQKKLQSFDILQHFIFQNKTFKFQLRILKVLSWAISY